MSTIPRVRFRGMRLFGFTDMLWEVLRRLSYVDRRSLSHTNKFIHEYYLGRKMGIEDVHGIPLYLGKKELIEEMIDISNQISVTNFPNGIQTRFPKSVVLIAPPSYGKTVVALAISLMVQGGRKNEDVVDDSERFVIAVPGSLITMWMKEIREKIPGAINRDSPGESFCLVINSMHKQHWKHFRQNGLSAKNRMLLVSHASYLDTGRRFNAVSLSIRSANCIVDEAHKGEIASNVLHSRYPNRLFLLSASPIDIPHDIDREAARLVVNRDAVSDHIPNVVFHNTYKSYETILRRNLERSDKVLFFCENVESTKDILSSIQRVAADYKAKVIRFAASVAKIQQFEKVKGKAILLVPYGRFAVGFSVSAEAAILYNADDVSIERMVQVMSRTLRITNNNEQVYITNIFDPEEKDENDDIMLWPRIKKAVAAAKILYDVEIDDSYYNPPARAVTRKIMQELEVDIEKLSDLEVLLFVAPNSAAMRPIFQKEGLLGKKLRRKILARIYY